MAYSGDWAPEFPTDPEFYRRALHHMPSPLVVVNDVGEIVYANHAMQRLGGWKIPTASRNIMEHVHPEDRENLIEAFGEIVDSPGARVLGTGRSWAEIYFRIVTADGTTLPVTLVGSGGLMDPAVQGIIYEVRPARARTLLGRVLDGLSQGASMHQLLTLIATMIASPPLDLDAAILQSTETDTWLVAASTHPALAEAVRGDSRGLPWHTSLRQPGFMSVSQLPARPRDTLAAAGFHDLWHVAVDSPLTPNTLRLIATSPTHHVPSTGPLSRLVHARELASAVLLRSETDVLLASAADHDPLTDLPNRAAFYQHAEGADPLQERCIVHLDIDGLKQVNASLGQATGDAVLQIVADRLRSVSDDDAVIGRIGDDEFAILLTDTQRHDELLERGLALAQKVLTAVQDSIVVAGRSVQITASVGVAAADGGISTDHLITWADAAMHDAKIAGGGRIHRYQVAFG